MAPDPQQDPAVCEQQYANDRNLAARQSIYAYTTVGGPHVDWVLDFACTGAERVLDVGCGNGTYENALSRRGHTGPVVPVDLSAGMLAAVASGTRVRGDAQSLPFRSESFDVVLAPHMLYHVPDRPAAIAEMQRVMTPDGTALVVTNSVRHLQELFALLRSVGVPWTAENGGPDLERSFARVERHDREGQLDVPDYEPIESYVNSMMVDFDRDAAFARIAETMRRDGSLKLTVAMCCFVCRN